MFLPRHVAFCVFAFILLHKVTSQESSLDSSLVLPKSNGVLLKSIEVRDGGDTGELCPEMVLASKWVALGNEHLQLSHLCLIYPNTCRAPNSGGKPDRHNSGTTQRQRVTVFGTL